MSDELKEIPVEVRMAIVERNLTVLIQQTYDISLNLAAERLGMAEGDKDSPEATRLKALAVTAMKKRDYFEGKMKELEAEKEKADKARDETK